METVIDWSKAPEWASAYAQVIYEHETTAKDFAWVCAEGYNVNPFGVTEQVCHPYMKEFFTADRFRLIEFRPTKYQAWSGEGLPPVGTVCEVKGCMSHYLQWNKVTVFAVRGKTVMFDMEDGRWGQTDSHEFRPIRTPEQIAADERDKAAADMFKLFYSVNDTGKEAMFRLYDAGYRLQVQP